MSNYTPGPWKIDNFGGSSFICTNDDPSTSICRVTHQNTINNANLISASPEMYEALKIVDSCLCYGISDSIDAMKDIARSAIAKANGKP